MSRRPENAGRDGKVRFGKREPQRKLDPNGADARARQRKRTAAMAMTALGVSAVGAVMWASTENCKPANANDPFDARPVCRSRSSWRGFSGGGGNGSAGATTQATQRGGFGRTGLSFSSHGGS